MKAFIVFVLCLGTAQWALAVPKPISRIMAFLSKVRQHTSPHWHSIGGSQDMKSGRIFLMTRQENGNQTTLLLFPHNDHRPINQIQIADIDDSLPSTHAAEKADVDSMVQKGLSQKDIAGIKEVELARRVEFLDHPFGGTPTKTSFRARLTDTSGNLGDLTPSHYTLDLDGLLKEAVLNSTVGRGGKKANVEVQIKLWDPILNPNGIPHINVDLRPVGVEGQGRSLRNIRLDLRPDEQLTQIHQIEIDSNQFRMQYEVRLSDGTEEIRTVKALGDLYLPPISKNSTPPNPTTGGPKGWR